MEIPDKTFRVRGVPLDWEPDHLESFLQQQDDTAQPTVRSLACEIHGRSSSATVSFQRHPSRLQDLSHGKTWDLPLQSQLRGRPESVSLDVDFYGMTTLFSPPGSDHKVDVVAVSGLGGHAFGSFKKKGGEHMWLRDALPLDLTNEVTDRPMARVMIYGYESAVADSQSMQNLEDLATAFHSSILPLAASPQMKPILFIAHSLGGLIVKQALITLARSKNEDDQRLLQAVYGIAFFGVPHDGMDIGSLIPMVGDGPNRALVESLSRINSQILTMQQRDFHWALGPEGQTEIVCFYETMLSPTRQQNEMGEWKMSDLQAVLVTKTSATHCRSWENGPEHICSIARSHSEMVKFGPHDPEYDRACQRLKGVARRAMTGGRRRETLGTKFLVPYVQNRDFVERSVVSELKRQLGFGQHTGCVATRAWVALYGLGGVGKTQIALAYVYWMYENRPEVSVFWVHASNAERFRESYSTIAEECHIPGHDDPKKDILQLVQRWLEKDPGPWLMVIDNADDAELFFGSSDGSASGISPRLGQYLPESSRGAILITTRNKEAGIKLAKGILPIRVGHMEEAECKALLRNRLGDVDRIDDEVSVLSKRLEHLPLALVQAAAFIEEKTITVQDYLEMINESDQSLVNLLSEEFETVGRDNKTPRAVALTWMVSFQQIQRQNALAGRLLSFMSMLDCQGIPKEFLTSYGGQSKLELSKALGMLKAFCLVVEVKSGSFDMHRLVHLVTCKWLAKEGAMDGFRRDALLTMSRKFPWGGDFDNRTTCIAYLPHANAVLQVVSGLAESQWEEAEEKEAKAVLLHNMAGHFLVEGRWKQAEELEVQVMETMKRVLGEEHPDTLASIGNLASTFRTQGLWKEAEELGVQVVEATKRVLGDEHPDTLASIGNLASTFRTQGLWKEAEELEVQAMETCKRVLGEEHPDTLVSMNNLASTFRMQGLWKEAEELFMRVVETMKRVLGDEHPSTLRSIGNLASTYWKQGRWKDAEELEVWVMKATKRVLGDEHPDTLTSIANLASTYSNQGRWKQAKELEVQVMETRERVLGDEHPSTLTSMNNLAFTLHGSGKLEDAIQLMENAIRLRQRVYGSQHTDTRYSVATLQSWKETLAKLT